MPHSLQLLSHLGVIIANCDRSPPGSPPSCWSCPTPSTMSTYGTRYPFGEGNLHVCKPMGEPTWGSNASSLIWLGFVCPYAHVWIGLVPGRPSRASISNPSWGWGLRCEPLGTFGYRIEMAPTCHILSKKPSSRAVSFSMCTWSELSSARRSQSSRQQKMRKTVTPQAAITLVKYQGAAREGVKPTGFGLGR